MRRLPAIAFFASYFAVIPAFAADATLPGDYESGGVTLSLTTGGRYSVSQGGASAVEGTYRIEGDTVTFTDESGPYACAAAKPPGGTYSWKIEETALTLRRLSDACAERAADLTSHVWQRK